MSLTLFGCAAKSRPVIPISQDVIVLREDGCRGRASDNDKVLLGVVTYNELAQFLNWCVQQRLLPDPVNPPQPEVVPDDLTCPGITNDELKLNALLMTRQGVARLANDLNTCVANGQAREDAQREAEKEKRDI